MREFEGSPNLHYSDKGSHKKNSDYHKALRQLRRMSGSDVPERGLLFLGKPAELEAVVREEIQYSQPLRQGEEVVLYENNPAQTTEH